MKRMLWLCTWAAMGATFLLYFTVRGTLMDWLLAPCRRLNVEVVFLSPEEAFFTALKLCMMVALMAVFPFILREILCLLLPLIHCRDKKVFYALGLSSLSLFYLGIFTGHSLLPLILSFLFKENSFVDLSSYFSFVASFMLFLGIIFEMPVVILFLSYLGCLSPEMLSRRRRQVFLAAFLGTSLLAPGSEAVAQLALFLPAVSLYEASIWLSRGLPCRWGIGVIAIIYKKIFPA